MRRNTNPLSLTCVAVSLFALISAGAQPASRPAEVTAVVRPWPGIAYHEETWTEPPERVFVAEIDLANPKVKLRTCPGGADPDGAGEWETTLMTPSKVARREGFELAVNGDFFLARNVKDAEGAASQYRSEIWAAAVGPAMTDGKSWSVGKEKTPCLVVRKNGRVSIETVVKPPKDAVQVIAGNTLLVEGGKVVERTNKARHPRTVIGLDAKRKKLTIVVLDGRKPGVSVGMSYAELSADMIRRGCDVALNLDGGGSSAMVLRDPKSGELRVMNVPSDGRERAVANVLGVDCAK